MSLASFDLFPKVDVDQQVKTKLGGATSILTLCTMLYLFFAELHNFMHPPIKEHITVDTSAGKDLFINFNVSFPRLPCYKVHLDVVDKGGDIVLDIHDNVLKQRFIERKNKDDHRTYIGEPFSTEPEYDKGAMGAEGCLTWGRVRVNKVAGNMHWAIGSSALKNVKQHAHSFSQAEVEEYDASFIIHSFWFGAPHDFISVRGLDNSQINTDEGEILHTEFHMQVVPTTFVQANSDGSDLETNHFTFTHHFHVLSDTDPYTEKTIPGLFMYYDLSPFKMEISISERPLLHFLTTCCAIIGGTFTVSAMWDSCLYHTAKRCQRSSEN
jgi:hypothetical protein